MSNTEIIKRNRNPLWYRERADGTDVKEAIANILRSDPFVSRFTGTKLNPCPNGLPKGVTKEMVAEELVRMKCSDPENNFRAARLPAGVDRQWKHSFMSALESSVIFRVGYRNYAEDTNQQIVPVTEHFFRYVYSEETRDVLDAMTEADIHYSLPRRESKPIRDANGAFVRPGHYQSPDVMSVPLDVKGMALAIRKDDDGNAIYSDEVISSGKVAGVMIFPASYPKNGLMRAWFDRNMNGMEGKDKAVAKTLLRSCESELTRAEIEARLNARSDMIGEVRDILNHDKIQDYIGHTKSEYDDE